MGALRARFSPEALTGWLAFLAGQQPSPAPVSAKALTARFSWADVPKTDIAVPAELMGN